MSVTPINRPPRSEESERALLGALLLNSAVAWPLISDVVGTEHLARPDHKLIFTAIAELVADHQAADMRLVIDRLGDRLEAAGGREYIASLIEDTGSAANARSYALAVRDTSDRAKWIDAASTMARIAREESADAAAQFAVDTVGRFAGSSGLKRARPLVAEPASAWADRPEPAPRDWVVENIIPAARVSSLYGDGGLGKTLLAIQLAMHVSLSLPLFGIPIKGGPVLGIFCEDEQDELNRRQRAACAGERLTLRDVDNFYPISRDGMDNLLCTFENEQIKFTQFYHELESTIEVIGPRLVLLDTLADLFAGDFISTSHVRQFVKVALGGLCVRHGCAIVLLAHPSQTGKNTGDGGFGSVAWSNSVRSRLFLRTPKSDDPEQIKDRRVLQHMKTNYGPGGTVIPLMYENGYFVLDQEPVDEAESHAHREREGTTKLTLSIMRCLEAADPASVPRSDLLQQARICHAIPSDLTDVAAEQRIKRTLGHLVREGVIRRTETPRGSYRMIQNARGQ